MEIFTKQIRLRYINWKVTRNVKKNIYIYTYINVIVYRENEYAPKIPIWKDLIAHLFVKRGCIGED